MYMYTGLLEKDVTKRLGAAKSSMFSIGGVTALKVCVCILCMCTL